MRVSSVFLFFMFTWAEAHILRARVYVHAAKQQNYELHPQALPDVPGGGGTIS